MAFALHRRMNIARRNVAVNVVELGKEREPNNNGKMSVLMANAQITIDLGSSRSPTQRDSILNRIPWLLKGMALNEALALMRTTSALSSSMSTLSMCRAAGNLVQLIENPAFETLSGKYLDSMGKQI
ncbi:hypothetical protein TELCIR_17402, partial [Teladorsagia circumcincta]